MFLVVRMPQSDPGVSTGPFTQHCPQPYRSVAYNNRVTAGHSEMLSLAISCFVDNRSCGMSDRCNRIPNSFF